MWDRLIFDLTNKKGAFGSLQCPNLKSEFLYLKSKTTAFQSKPYPSNYNTFSNETQD